MATAGFVHLHGHSEYSLLDGGCSIGEMPVRAAEHGMPALAITDHGNLFGAIAHYKACKEAGIKPIIGCEVYVAIESRHSRQPARGLKHASNHLVLLAKNTTGYNNLTKLVSAGYLEGYYYNPRIDKELLRRHAEGLICLSACVSGEIPHLIQQEGVTAAETAAREYLDIFGEDYYLEMQRHGIDNESMINAGLLEVSEKLGVPLVATNDFHFLRAEDHAAHAALICIQTGKTLADSDRMCYPDGLYMKSPDEMYQLFGDIPDALENTLEVAEKCDLEFNFNKMNMPAFPIPEGYADDNEYLAHLAEEGLKNRYPRVDADLQKRLDYEIGVIQNMGYAGYFLIAWDCVKFAREKNISVGRGRGSAAGSLVAYSLDITGTDPIKYNLLFERFLDPERGSPPDIDLDFADTERDQLIRYLADKYGEANVCQVITFGTMGAKAVIRDVGRVLGMPYDEVDRMAKLVPAGPNVTLENAIGRVPELKQESAAAAEKSELFSYARKLEGLARHASVHACAVIIAPGNLTDFVPLYKAPKDGRVTTQFDGPTCLDVGLLKVDILGLKELSLLDETVRLIRQREPGFDPEAILWDDRATFDLFSRGETIGVFQFESSGMREYLRQLKPDKIEDLIAMAALYRPGPMESIPDYIARKHGQKEVVYDHPDMEPILAETYGVLVYQEQVMSVAHKLAGFTLSNAYSMIKAIAKKQPEEMAKMRKAFISGCTDNGVEVRVAEKVFGDVEVFAGYGFNKSHSAPYSEIAYRNAYLKANFPEEYMAASLTVAGNNTATLAVLLDECRRMEIPVLAPDVNNSVLHFTPTEDGIRFGLAAIKNVGEGAAQGIVDARLPETPFGSIFDLCERVDLRLVNRRVLESLASSGAMDGLEGHRAQQFGAVETALRSAQKVQEEKERGQISLFGPTGFGGSDIEPIALPEAEEWSETEKLKRERELLGFYLSGHPLSRYAQDLQAFTTPIARLDEQRDGALIRVGGLVTRISTIDRRGQQFAFATLEDLSGRGDVAFFAEAYGAHRELLEEDRVILVEGRVSARNGRMSLQAASAMPLDQAREVLTRALNLSLPYEAVQEEMLTSLRRICERYLGECELLLHLKNGGQKNAIVRSRTIRVKPCDDLLREIDALIGPKRTWLTMASQQARQTSSVYEGKRTSA